MLKELNRYVKRLSILLITVALIVVMGGCLFSPSSQDLEIRTWYDLDAVRNNPGNHHVLMNDLDSTILGYEELASPTANEGKGWRPIIGSGGDPAFTGIFDGQGYEIRDLFINLPDKGYVGIFSVVGEGGRIENTGVVNADVTGYAGVGALAGVNEGTVSNSYSTGSLTGTWWVGGLVGKNDWTVSDSFWDIETSGQATSPGGTGKTKAQMKNIATYSGMEWDIVTVAPGVTNPTYTWNIVDGQTYPFLSWEL